MLSNVKLEKIIIGTVIASPNSIHEVSALLKPAHFSTQPNKIIWGTLLELQIDQIDRMILANRLSEKGKLDLVGGDEYLIELVRSSESPTKIAQYAEMLFDLAWKNQMAVFFQDALEKTKDATIPTKTIIAEAQQGFYELIQFGIKSEVTKIGDSIDGVIDRVVELSGIPKDERPVGVPTGFIDLDKVLGGGMKGGDFVVFAGRPAMGKSVLAHNIALNASSKHGKKVLFFSMEMSTDQISERIIAMDNKIELSRIRNIEFEGDKGSKQLEKLKTRKGKYNKTPLLICDKAGISPVEVAAISRHVNNIYGVDLIIVDYIQIMNGSKPGNNNREQEINHITLTLKNLARELEIPIIGLSQVGRQVEDRADKRPGMSDLRESGSIENNADIVVFIYRDDVYNEDSEDAGTAELNFAKFRNGDGQARLRLMFAGEYQKFADFAQEKVPF